jgi:two-component system chemotaxis response regulator CheB
MLEAGREVVTVAVVDDSPLVRRVLRRIFESAGDFQVVGEAASGAEAVDLVARLRPRLVTIDVLMPGMDGLEAIELIMAKSPTRVLVITGAPVSAGRDLSFEALSRGALELVPKPAAWPDLAGGAELLETARRLAALPVVPHVGALRSRRLRDRDGRAASPDVTPCNLVVIGASTGGPRTLAAILAELPADLQATVIVVQHLAESFGEGFVEWLAGQTRLAVREARHGERLDVSTVLVGARGSHVTVGRSGTVVRLEEPPRHGHRPSIDLLFASAAARGDRACGVLLTGMGSDGAEGLLDMARAGSVTIAQDEATSTVFGMPQAAIARGAAQHVLPREDVAHAVARAVRGQRLEGRS